MCTALTGVDGSPPVPPIVYVTTVSLPPVSLSAAIDTESTQVASTGSALDTGRSSGVPKLDGILPSLRTIPKTTRRDPVAVFR